MKDKPELKAHLEMIMSLIVSKDPDDNDKFLRKIWDEANLALELLADPLSD